MNLRRVGILGTVLIKYIHNDGEGKGRERKENSEIENVKDRGRNFMENATV